MSTAISKALEIHEILDQIVCLLDKATLAQVARVNRDWSDVALDYLWRDPGSFVRLVSILHPLCYTADRYVDLAADPPSKYPDWERYDFYLKRIHVLWYDDLQRSLPDCTHSVFTPRIFELLVNHGPYQPNLKMLRWVISMHGPTIVQLPPFIPPTLKILRIVYGFKPHVPSLVETFKTLALRSDIQLDEFRYRLDLDRTNAEALNAVTPFLQSLKSIHTLRLAVNQWTEALITSVATLNQLRFLDLELLYSWPNHMSASLDFLSTVLPHIDTLKLRWGINSGYSPQTDLFNYEPILRWNLVDVELERHSEALVLTADDFVKMSKAWPRLKRYKLNWAKRSPHSHHPKTSLPLSLLAQLPGLFPDLEELNTVFEWERSKPLEEPPTPFRKLRALCASEWDVPDEQVPHVAKYLAALCPLGSKTLGNAWHHKAYVYGSVFSNRISPNESSLLVALKEAMDQVGTVAEDQDSA